MELVLSVCVGLSRIWINLKPNMPLGKRIVQPICLSRASIGDDDSKFDLDQVSNNALVCVLQQLGSLASHAEDLFGELAEEVENILTRCDRIKTKVEKIRGNVNNLNAKQVHVREYHSIKITHNILIS